MQLIKVFPDQTCLIFSKGGIDEWCIYYIDHTGKYYPPQDKEYFARFKEFGKIYGNWKVYNDFMRIFNLTTNRIDNNVLNLIENISKSYYRNELQIQILFTTIYAGMIAEENKQGAIIKKYMKRLGMYQILIEDWPAQIAASWSRGKYHETIAYECMIRGFMIK